MQNNHSSLQGLNLPYEKTNTELQAKEYKRWEIDLRIKNEATLRQLDFNSLSQGEVDLIIQQIHLS